MNLQQIFFLTGYIELAVTSQGNLGNLDLSASNIHCKPSDLRNINSGCHSHNQRNFLFRLFEASRYRVMPDEGQIFKLLVVRIYRAVDD